MDDNEPKKTVELDIPPGHFGVPLPDLSVLLPLDVAERGVCWRNREGVTRTHVFRRLTEADWNGYFGKIVIESDSDSQTIDFNGAKVWLYDRCIARTEGYGAFVPFGHRMIAVDKLTEVHRSGEPVQSIQTGLETVKLDAKWGVDADGKMIQFTGLVHRFTPPSAAQFMEFSRETNRSLVVKGSQKGRTIRAIRQKVLLKFYDELIQSVEGYGTNGVALGNRAHIIREMDAGHKAVAMTELFSVVGEDEAGEGEAGEES